MRGESYNALQYDLFSSMLGALNHVDTQSRTTPIAANFATADIHFPPSRLIPTLATTTPIERKTTTNPASRYHFKHRFDDSTAWHLLQVIPIPLPIVNSQHL